MAIQTHVVFVYFVFCFLAPPIYRLASRQGDGRLAEEDLPIHTATALGGTTNTQEKIHTAAAALITLHTLHIAATIHTAAALITAQHSFVQLSIEDTTARNQSNHQSIDDIYINYKAAFSTDQPLWDLIIDLWTTYR